MESVVLVDSCVYIKLLREKRDPAAELMERLQLEDLATCAMVRMEVIRGISTPRARRAFEQFFDVMQNVPTDNKLWEEATEMAWQLQRKGFAPPAQDLLIAASAKHIDAAVLTYDSHFEMIPGLRLYRSLEELT